MLWWSNYRDQYARARKRARRGNVRSSPKSEHPSAFDPRRYGRAGDDVITGPCDACPPELELSILLEYPMRHLAFLLNREHRCRRQEFSCHPLSVKRRRTELSVSSKWQRWCHRQAIFKLHAFLNADRTRVACVYCSCWWPVTADRPSYLPFGSLETATAHVLTT